MLKRESLLETIRISSSEQKVCEGQLHLPKGQKPDAFIHSFIYFIILPNKINYVLQVELKA